MTFTADQQRLVACELEAMFADGDRDEVWRILHTFGAELGADLPRELQEWFAGQTEHRERSYADLLSEAERVAAADDVFTLTRIGSVIELDLVKLTSRPASSQYAAQLGVCVVAGLHGDEADGVLGALQFARRFAASAELVNTYQVSIYPCVNPVGYVRMTRENGNGKDLNREFFRGSAETEVQVMERELGAREFTGMIAGHSDYETFGLYAYATGAVLSERLAKPALFQASGVIPINTDAVIDGHPASYGIINQKFPGSLGPLTKGTTEPFDITIETPNLLSLRKRVEAQAIAFETILHEYRAVAAEGMYL